MQTFRELHCAYIAGNRHGFTKTLLHNLEQSLIRYRGIMDLEYDKVTDQMLDEGIRTAKTDYTRTRIAFLIHEYDRATGVEHHLEYDRVGEQEGAV